MNHSILKTPFIPARGCEQLLKHGRMGRREVEWHHGKRDSASKQIRWPLSTTCFFAQNLRASKSLIIVE